MSTDSLRTTDAYSALSATAPRVSLADMEAKVAERYYLVAGEGLSPNRPSADDPNHPLNLLTLCFLVMSNGFTVVGKSAPASPANFDAEKGRTFAYEDAIRQLWPLEGYALRERLTAEA